MINLVDSLKTVERTQVRLEKIENRYDYYLFDLTRWRHLSVEKKRDSSRAFYISIHSFKFHTDLISLETFTTDYKSTGDHQAGPQYTYVQLLETYLETGQVLSLEEFTLFCLFCGYTNQVTTGKQEYRPEKSENNRIKEDTLEEGKPFKYTHMFDKYDQGNIVVTKRVNLGTEAKPRYSRDLEDYPEFLPLRESLILPKFYDDLVNGSVLTFDEFKSCVPSLPLMESFK